MLLPDNIKPELTIYYNGNTSPTIYKYRFDGNTLIIKDATGKDNKFAKVK